MIQRFQSDQFPIKALPFYVVRAAASIRANLDRLPNPRDMGHVGSHCIRSWSALSHINSWPVPRGKDRVHGGSHRTTSQVSSG